MNPLVGLKMTEGSLITEQLKRMRSGVDPSVAMTTFS